MNREKKHLKLFTLMVMLYVIGVIATGMLAVLETGVPRAIFMILAVISFCCGVTQFLLYRYFFSQHNSKDIPKEAGFEYGRNQNEE